ncbi:hypothetical protein HOA91_04150 [Candidatus Woesearchaeota archaeon]|jgi:hypothetical protein|nr:hypothetical protein [Candidatus Woesearchaeota archaeon]
MGSEENLIKEKERKSKLGSYASMAGLLGCCGVVAIAMISSAYKSEHVPLTERLEKAYQTCQKIEDKTREIEFAPSVYSSCQEIENLYLKVNRSDSMKTDSHERTRFTRTL